MGRGLNWLIAGLAAGVALPALAFGLGQPFLISFAISAAVFFGLVLTLAPRRPLEGMSLKGLSENRIALVRDLLEEAMPLADRLDEAARSIKDAALRQRFAHLASIARGIFATIESDPARLDKVRRFLTYYLPRAAEVSEGALALSQQRQPDPARLAQVVEVIGRLDEAFTRYSDSLMDADLDRLDLDLRLLKQSLDEDLVSDRRRG